MKANTHLIVVDEPLEVGDGDGGHSSAGEVDSVSDSIKVLYSAHNFWLVLGNH